MQQPKVEDANQVYEYYNEIIKK